MTTSPCPFPESIKLQGVTISVEMTKAHTFDGVESLGRYNFCEAKIELAQAHVERNPDYAVQTLLHELVHAILMGNGYSEEGKDEKLVNILANSMHQVLRDNPELVSVYNHLPGQPQATKRGSDDRA